MDGFLWMDFIGWNVLDASSTRPADRPQVSESYRKLRNTLRYLSGSLFDFDPTKDSVPYEDLPSLDK